MKIVAAPSIDWRGKPVDAFERRRIENIALSVWSNPTDRTLQAIAAKNGIMLSASGIVIEPGQGAATRAYASADEIFASRREQVAAVRGLRGEEVE